MSTAEREVLDRRPRVNGRVVLLLAVLTCVIAGSVIATDWVAARDRGKALRQ